MVINVRIIGQNIEVRTALIASDTIDYLTAKFVFSKEWDGYTKYATFRKGNEIYQIKLIDDVILSNQHINLGEGKWTVSCHGDMYNGEDVVSRITTVENSFVVKKSGVIDGEPFPTINPSVGEQIVAQAENEARKAKEEAEHAEVSANNALTYANRAASSATAANVSKEDAQRFSSQARESANEAKTSADQAKEYADDAKVSSDFANASKDLAAAEANRAAEETAKAAIETSRARLEADRARAEADRSNAEADRASLEAGLAQASSLNAKESEDEARRIAGSIREDCDILSRDIVKPIDEATDVTQLAYKTGARRIEVPTAAEFELQNAEIAKLSDEQSKLSESIVKISDSVETKVEGGRVLPISNSADIAQVYETVGCPEYIGNDDLSKYSPFGLTESGWYLFARINSRYGESVSNGFSVVGASGVITPSIGGKYVDIAVRFGVVAESQKVIVNWGASSETFVFKATDLAIRNLDYRVTFYLYNIDDYCEWTYEITADEKFVKDKGYYKLIDDEYIKQEVAIDETIPSNTYYCHKSLVIKDFTRNMSYTLDTTVDCPVTIHLPEVGGDNYGAWFEVQMNFLETYSVTIIPHEGQKVSANGVHSPKVGINIINILYHKPTNTWLPTVTNWAVSST